MRRSGAGHGVSRTHGVPQLLQRIAAGQSAEKQTAILHRMANQAKRQRKIVDRIQRPYGKNEVVAVFRRVPCIFNESLAASALGIQRPRIANVDIQREGSQPLAPAGIGRSDQQGSRKGPLHQPEPLQAVVERALIEKQFRANPRRPVPATRSCIHVEQVRHCGACALPSTKRQGVMVRALVRSAVRWALDFALPPRCAGCGAIVGGVHSFCLDCWRTIEFLGHSGCKTCGIPLQATEQTTCGACLARPPRIARTRAAVAYDDLSRSLAIRLKYGRKVAIARTMARYMAPLVGEGQDRILVPVPLHRTRIWRRGFNQSALIASELSRRVGIAADPFALKRVRGTPPLKGMSALQRRKTVAGAFRVRDKQAIVGKTIILIDDVLTTGSTAEACARVLKRAGAARVELVSWARVVRPTQLMR